MSFITKGLTWFQNQRHEHCTVEIEIGLSAPFQTILATISQDDDAASTQNRLTQQKQIFHFIVRRVDQSTLQLNCNVG